MNVKKQIPRPGEFYRNAANKLYQVAALATHVENGGRLVICQELFGQYRVLAWPLSAFSGAEEGGQCPDPRHQGCFERVDTTEQTEGSDSGEGVSGIRDGQEDTNGRQLNPHLLEFFEAMDVRDYDRMLEALDRLSRTITQKELEDICMVMDLKPLDGDTAEQVASIRKQIRMLRKFDGDRLR